jgi:FAD/FMN-containing dehydrogenase
MVQTWGLNYVQVGIDNETHVTTDYVSIKDRLVFVQGGVMILDIHKASPHKTGSADGQRIAGAINTGVHGSAIGNGVMEEYVRGIHIVLPGNDHVFIQRSTDRVITHDFTEWLDGARLIENDDKFNAAVVGLGRLDWNTLMSSKSSLFSNSECSPGKPDLTKSTAYSPL